jgi:hypothetical protein
MAGKVEPNAITDGEFRAILEDIIRLARVLLTRLDRG